MQKYFFGTQDHMMYTSRRSPGGTLERLLAFYQFSVLYYKPYLNLPAILLLPWDRPIESEDRSGNYPYLQPCCNPMGKWLSGLVTGPTAGYPPLGIGTWWSGGRPCCRMAIGWGIEGWSADKTSYGIDKPGTAGRREKDFILHVDSLEDLWFGGWMNLGRNSFSPPSCSSSANPKQKIYELLDCTQFVDVRHFDLGYIDIR